MKGTTREAIAVLTPVLAVLADAVTSAENGSEFRHALGVLKSELSAQIQSGEAIGSLVDLFDLAWKAGTTIERMDRVRQTAEAQTPFYLSSRILVSLCVRHALVVQSMVIAATTFASRTEIESLLERLNSAFDSAEQDASANREAAVYRAIVTLHATVTRDLLGRSRPLPRVVPYKLARPTSSIRLAHRLYYNAAREGELRRENRTPHPLFMPFEGKALSA